MHAHISLKRHHNPNKKGLLCPKSKASGPRWRGRSAWMREPFAIGHSSPFDGSHLTAISQPFSRPASKTSNNTPIPSKRHPNPTKKGLLCPKSKASGPRWRGRSAWMRESFAIGHSRPCDGSRLTATSHQPPATSHFPAPPLRPQTTRPSHQSDITTPTRKACYARRAKRLARDGVADPHGCGNPLRSGIVGLSAAPNSQQPATSNQP